MKNSAIIGSSLPFRPPFSDNFGLEPDLWIDKESPNQYGWKNIKAQDVALSFVLLCFQPALPTVQVYIFSSSAAISCCSSLAFWAATSAKSFWLEA